MPYHKLLINLACLSCVGQYRPLVISVLDQGPYCYYLKPIFPSTAAHAWSLSGYYFCGTSVVISPLGGSVEEYGKLHEVQAVHILGKVISAVKFMHSRRLLHGDIKGQFIVIHVV